MRRMSDLVRNQNPLILPPNASIKEAARQMRDRPVGAVLVAEAGDRLVGIFTAVMPLPASSRRATTPKRLLSPRG